MSYTPADQDTTESLRKLDEAVVEYDRAVAAQLNDPERWAKDYLVRARQYRDTLLSLRAAIRAGEPFPVPTKPAANEHGDVMLCRVSVELGRDIAKTHTREQAELLVLRSLLSAADSGLGSSVEKLLDMHYSS